MSQSVAELPGGLDDRLKVTEVVAIVLLSVSR